MPWELIYLIACVITALIVCRIAVYLTPKWDDAYTFACVMGIVLSPLIPLFLVVGTVAFSIYLLVCLIAGIPHPLGQPEEPLDQYMKHSFPEITTESDIQTIEGWM